MDKFHQFTYKDPFNRHEIKKLPEALRVNDTSIEEAILIRLLLGTLDIKHTLSKKKISQRYNYSMLPGEISETISYEVIQNFLDKSLVEVMQLDTYLSKSKTRNRRFFKDLLAEFSNYFHHTSKGSHTLAFLHLYRILEHISYCFPLLYAAKATEYEVGYSQLKSFFEGKSELSFFKKFLETLFTDQSFILTADWNIIIKAPHTSIRKDYFKTLGRLCDQTAIKPKVKIQDQSITIQYADTIPLVIETRNRFFHFAANKGNLSCDDVVESDFFFKMINNDVANFMAMIYFEILVHSINNQ